jgi:hypothetical protein
LDLIISTGRWLPKLQQASQGASTFAGLAALHVRRRSNVQRLLARNSGKLDQQEPGRSPRPSPGGFAPARIRCDPVWCQLLLPVHGIHSWRG